MSARWACTKCGATLKFDPARRKVVAVGVVALIVLLFLLQGRIPAVVLFPGYVVFIVLLGLIDGVVEAAA